jgi:hypothetical protein
MNARETLNNHDRCASGAIVAVLCILAATPALSKITLKPGVMPGEEVYQPNARDLAYCEIAPVLGTPPNLVAQFYNTSKPGDSCPLDKFEAIDAKNLATELGSDFVYMNPTPQSARRHWVMDQLWIFKGGETVDFHGVKATWMASMSPELMKGMVRGPYTPGEIHRESKYLNSKCSKVFLLHSPEGRAYVMQSYATEVDKNLTFDQLPQLGSKLKLPSGYTFEVKTLTEDLTIDPGKANGVAHLIRDDLHDMYEGCGFDQTCNYVP